MIRIPATSNELHRRTVLRLAFPGLLALWGARAGAQGGAIPAAAAAEGTEMVEFRWELPERYGRRVADDLGLPSTSVTRKPGQPNRGVPIVVIVIAVIALVRLAQAIIDVYRDLRYGGLIVEDTGTGLTIRNDPRLPARVIIVKDRNGVTIRELRGDVGTRDLIPSLRSAGGRKSLPPPRP